MKNSNNKHLSKLRHSAAHLLAAAVMELWPDTKRAIGPSIKDGFYYDFEFSSPISVADLKKIEKEMRKIVKSWNSFEKKMLSSTEAKSLYSNNTYKHELIDEFSENGKKKVSFYYSGNFFDLCKGGHIKNPAQELRHFKLLSIAGAYWRGDEKNKMLTRIYGTAFASKDELESYLKQQDEAKKRDHRILGKKLDLFTFSDKVGPGLPLWTPKGTIIRQILDNYIWSLRKEKGYEKVEIPHITKKELYVVSGHWKKFSDELLKIKTREGNMYALKPMNCPHHTQIFARKQHSYRQMPQRYANTTMVYRDEQSGELLGLTRVLSITQDDAHVFCRENQVAHEISAIWDIVERFYRTFNLKLRVRLSFYDPKKFSEYLGSKKIWEQTQNEMKDIAKKRGKDYDEAIGEAAFYGPKVDFIATDSLKREWQVATIQIDRNMPNRFDLYCINEKGKKEDVVMIHAAIMGAVERFLGILIEHYAGVFPLWLSPVQIAVLPVSNKFDSLANKISLELQNHDIRTKLDLDNKTLSAKIREWTLQKVPYLCIIGAKEKEAYSSQKQLHVSVRNRHGENLGMIKVNQFIDKLQKHIESKTE